MRELTYLHEFNDSDLYSPYIHTDVEPYTNCVRSDLINSLMRTSALVQVFEIFGRQMFEYSRLGVIGFTICFATNIIYVLRRNNLI